MSAAYDIVVPTVGRDSLRLLLASLADAAGPPPARVIVVDDRRERLQLLALDAAGGLRERIEVLTSGGVGPAAARNLGWRAASAAWIAFLDDDVVVDERWRADLVRDLAAAGTAAASQGRLSVPLPADRPPTDWERNVKGLEGAPWITADCAFRRAALEAVGGFDERFRRAYREDADLALRLLDRGFTLAAGTRRTRHPVRPADPWVSVRLQAGNADDALMDALHGSDWRARVGAQRGAFGRYPPIVASALIAAGGSLVWLVLTARFAWQRIAPGPRSLREIAAMCATSAAIPFAAVYHRWRGVRRARGAT